MIVIRVAEFLLLHLVFHRLTCLVLLHVKDLVEVGEEVCILVSGPLPVNSLTKLFNRSALLQVEVPFAHQSKHLLLHRRFLPQALLVQTYQFF